MNLVIYIKKILLLLYMSRAQLYREAKRKARQIGLETSSLRSLWRRSTSDFWRTRIQDYNNILENRIQFQPIFEQIQQRTEERERQNRINRRIRENSFNAILNGVLNDDVLSENQAQRFWNNLQGSGRYIMTVRFTDREEKIAVNHTTRDFIFDILTQGQLIEQGTTWGSDKIDSFVIRDIINIFVEILSPDRIIRNRDGRFFPYINTTNIDLSKYQIYNQNQAYEKKILNKRENCLIQTLKHQGIKKSVLNAIKLAWVSGVHIRKSDLIKIASLIERNINLYTISGDKIKIQKINGKKTEEDAPSKEQIQKEYDEYMKEHDEYMEEQGEYVDEINQKVLNDVHEEHTDLFNIRCRKRLKLEKEPDINIAMYENHYFTYEDTEYSKFSIENYDILKDINNFHEISRKTTVKGKIYYVRKNERKINSLSLVDNLYNQGKFKKLDLIKFEESSSHKETRNHIYLDNIWKEQRIFGKYDVKYSKEEAIEFSKIKNMCLTDERLPKYLKYTEDKTKRNRPTFYADVETFVKGVDNHELYLLGVVGSNNDRVDILNVMDERFAPSDYSSEQQVVNTWMDIMTRSGKNTAVCYYHNLKYDYHILEKYLKITKRCEKDGQIYNVECVHRGQKVELRDSFKLIPFALNKFGKEFNLPKEIRKKEAIAYDYYTRENNNKRIPTETYRNLLPNSEKIIFDEMVVLDHSYDSDSFNPLEYYKEYLRLDCLVLKKGIQKFDELIMEITEDQMSVFDCLTISSLTDKYMQKEGVYEGVYEIKGNLRAYVGEAVYGGRVCVNEKYKKQIIEGKISDYDGVSLYPSAINRLCREIGLPKGEAKRFGKANINKWENMTYSILTVKITKVNKIQQMPFIAQKDESSIKYINTPPDKPVIIDSITLKDYIDFHDIEYQLLDGVYWNNGGNKKMGEMIQRLFNARLKYKKTNTALANTIKLMLNSAYGKTIMKKTKTKKTIVKSYKMVKQKNGKYERKEHINLNNYVYNNFNTIKSYRELNKDIFEFECIKADFSYNRGHVGCAILSTSKRIMNEVFDVANDNEYPIYYTDTDSLHCNMDDVPKLESKYKEKYGKELNGTQLEQFHTDFDLNGSAGEIYATKSVFLGKKSYIDCLESVDKNGDKITGFHIRLKGITKEGLEHESKKYSDSYFGLYSDLSKGMDKNIVLNPFNKDENRQKVLFNFKNGMVSTKKEFIRKVKF